MSGSSAIALIASTAAALRNVISAHPSPPAFRASASGGVSFASWTTMTGNSRQGEMLANTAASCTGADYQSSGRHRH